MRKVYAGPVENQTAMRPSVHDITNRSLLMKEPCFKKRVSNPPKENTKMNNLMLKMYVAYKNVMAREEGQDLVEYALVVALIAFGAVAGMNALVGGINTAFQDVS